MSKRKLTPKADIAQALTDWRKAKRWTRKQAAEHLGVNVRTLESWEYGVRKPPALAALDKLWAAKRRGG